MQASGKELFRKYYNFILFALVALITVIVIKKQVNVHDFTEVLKRCNYWYLAVALFSMIVYWFAEAFMLQILIRNDYPHERFAQAFTLMMIGQYYNQATPSSSGGQPLQLLEMVQTGITAGTAAAVLVQKYALYQISVTFVGLIGIFFNGATIVGWGAVEKIFLLIGLIVNVAAAVLILIFAYRPRYARRILYFCIRIGCFFHIIKDKKKWTSRADRFIEQYTSAIGLLETRKKQATALLILNMAAVIVYYGITYWIYRALGLSAFSFGRIVLLQSVLYLLIAFIPLPGSAGGAEIGFARVFGPVFGHAATSIALIAWRVITFYFILAFGGLYIGLGSFIRGMRTNRT